jgi:hypothetical protein
MSDKIATLFAPGKVRFARAATRHRITKDSIRHVVANHRVHFEETPPTGRPGSRSTRLVYLGEDAQGRALEVMAVEVLDGDLLVIHAMPLRAKYRRQYEEIEK